jgi:predicted unusual protein kinase regulating ubiquinone biosynthesis (AarF/ABC1/UbiB family)
MDYLNEGSNAERFAENFSARPEVCVPRVFWSCTTRRVLTLEEIEAIKITNYSQIEAASIPRSEVAVRLFDTYLQQIFEDRFFHADPHPGNLFVFPASRSAEGEESGWKLVFVDFGMTGVVTPNQLTALREILIAVGTQDIPRLIRAYGIMGVLLPSADIDLLEKATRRAFERFWGKSTTEMVSMGHQEAMAFAQEFSGLLYDMPFQVPENLILLGRCLSILSGICSGLDTDFNVWTSVMPYAERLIAAETGKGGGKVLVQETLNILRTLVSLPGRADALIQRIEQGRLEVQIPEFKEQMARLERRTQRVTSAILFAVFFFGGLQLFLAGYTTAAWACGGAALLSLLWSLVGK